MHLLVILFRRLQSKGHNEVINLVRRPCLRSSIHFATNPPSLDAHLLPVDLPELKSLTNRHNLCRLYFGEHNIEGMLKATLRLYFSHTWQGAVVSIQTRLRAMVARDEFRRRRNKAATIVQSLP
uniref:Uncharacterized protein n=1 Tax=Lactuca sativa TaxID=4236 RepID=A0A9R1UPU1_LACSA|nr:hypothetical protein LSAT_V11C800390670 [Lactuca sativa]